MNEERENDSGASRCSLQEFKEAFEIWFREGEKNLRFDTEHADAKDIALDAATWARDFLNEH